MTPKEQLVIVRGQLKIARAALKRFAEGDARSWREAEEALDEIGRIEYTKLRVNTGNK